MRISDWSSDVCSSDLASFDINLRAFFQITLDDPDKPFAVDHDIMPFGALLALAGHPVLPLFAGRDADIGDLAAVLERLDFGIGAEIADQNYLVDAASHPPLPSARQCGG